MTRNLVTVGEHTIDANLLTPNGYVLDAGARDFIFARGLAERGCRVVAIDADPTVENPRIVGVAFANVALDDAPRKRTFVMDQDPQARRLDTRGNGPLVDVHTVTVEDIMARYEVKHWDVVKLDIEGAEMAVLAAWPGPIATQISVEFHEHCAPKPQSYYDSIFARLESQGYEIVQHVKEARMCCSANWWDTLICLKGA